VDPQAVHPSWTLSLPDDVELSAGADDRFVFSGPLGRYTLRWKDAIVRQPLMRLAERDISAGQLLDMAEAAGETDAAPRLLRFLQHLARRGLLTMAAHDGDAPLASLMPRSASFSLQAGAMPRGDVMLSRFACVRRWYGGLALESPLAFSRLLLHDERAVGLVHRLAAPLTIDDTAKGACGLSPESTSQLLYMLDHAQALTAVDEHGEPVEDAHDSLKYWEFHDLLFHTSSREGRYDGPIGGTLPWAHVADPWPPLPSERGETGAAIALFRPDLEKRAEGDPPFARVMERRQSVREYAAEPISAAQLGEFLYRVGRVREQFNFDFEGEGGPVTMGFASRPYPSAGGVYELELYPLVRRCRGIEPGLYHYDALRHRLMPIAADASRRSELLAGAGSAAGVPPEELQVLLILSARFPRMTWKYTGMAYAAILKDVGVLYQTMYLAATAMGLAPCGLGCGDADLFARTIGSDYYAETSVGEFLLGSRNRVRDGGCDQQTGSAVQHPP
jgi:oxazoline/thiazoline dehydrogenase